MKYRRLRPEFDNAIFACYYGDDKKMMVRLIMQTTPSNLYTLYCHNEDDSISVLKEGNLFHEDIGWTRAETQDEQFRKCTDFIEKYWKGQQQ